MTYIWQYDIFLNVLIIQLQITCLYLTAGYFMVLKLLRCFQFIDINTKHFQQLPNLKCLGLFSILYFIWDIGMMLVDTIGLSRDSGLTDEGQAEYHRHIKQHNCIRQKKTNNNNNNKKQTRRMRFTSRLRIPTYSYMLWFSLSPPRM